MCVCVHQSKLTTMMVGLRVMVVVRGALTGVRDNSSVWQLHVCPFI